MAGKKWIQEERGIRYYEHETRMHGKRRDRYYTIRHTVNGKQIQEALGWMSDGWTLSKVRLHLEQLQEAKRIGKGAVTLSEARQEAQKAREEQEAEEARIQATLITLNEFWNQVYQHNRAHKKASTNKSEDGFFKNWLQPSLGNIPLVQITSEHLDKVKNSMIAHEKSPRTIQYTMAVFSQVWHSAESRGIVSGTPPTQKVKLPKFDNKRIRFLSKEEAHKLLEALRNHSFVLYAQAILSLGCGLRAGEILSLTWSDIDMENELIIIRDPKSGKNRHAYITDEVRSTLQELAVDKTSNGLIFPTSVGTVSVQISKDFQKIVNELHLNDNVVDDRQKVVFHTLRHTFASWLVQAGTPIYTVANLMGHSTIAMTQRYAHLAPEGNRAAAMKLNDFLSVSD